MARRARAPRRHLNPGFVEAIRRSGTRQLTLAIMSRFGHANVISAMLHPEAVVAATPYTTRRLERLAEIVGFPPAEVFLDGEAGETSAA